MKSLKHHLSAILLTMIAVSGQTAPANATPEPGFKSDIEPLHDVMVMEAPKVSIMESKPEYIRKNPAVRREQSETDKKVTAYLTYDDNIYRFFDAMVKYPDGSVNYFSLENGGGSKKKGSSSGADKKVIMNLRDGKHDILFIFRNIETSNFSCVVKEKVDLSEISEMYVDVADASNKVTFSTYLPNGERLKRWVAQFIDNEGHEEFISEGNISKDWDSRDVFFCIGEGENKCHFSNQDGMNHYDYAANEYFEGFNSDESRSTVYINDVSSNVSIYYIEKYIADGKVNTAEMVWHGGDPLAVDNRKNPYMPFSFAMQPTPYSSKKSEVSTDSYFPYMCKTTFRGVGIGLGLSSNFEELFHANISKASNYKDNRLYLTFEQAEYAVPLEERDCYVYNLKSSDIHFTDSIEFINSMTNDLYSMVKPEDKRDLFANPFAFDMKRCDMRFGESAPFWRVRAVRYADGYSKLTLSSFGYIGEGREADILDTKIESVTVDNVDMTSDFSFNTWGAIDLFTQNSRPGQKWEIKLDNRNVEVEGIKGYAKLELCFTTKDRESLPVLQQEQFRNADDRITNKFGAAADGRLLVGTGEFCSNYMNEPKEHWQSLWYECKPTAPEIEVSYSPTGTDEWKRLDVTLNEDKYYPVGFGHYFEGSLRDILTHSKNGWFDLRIKLATADGDYQVQTISPAFKIESLSGVQAVYGDTDITVRGNDIMAPQDAEVYTIEGVPSGLKNLSPGVYIVRAAGIVKKVVIR